MFRLIFFGSWTIVHLYVFWHLSTLPAVTKRIPRKILIGAGLLLWAVGIVRRYLDDIGLASLERPFDVFVMNWLGLLFVVFFVLLAADIVSAFGLVFRHYRTRIRAAAVGLGLLLAGLAYFQAWRSPAVTEIEVRLEQLPSDLDGLVLVAFSDTHLGAFIDSDWLRARVTQINALRPDIVLILGDLFEGDYPLEDPEEMQAAFRALDPTLGVWAVTGNHELDGGPEATVRFLSVADITVLRNEWVEVEPGLVIGGVDDGGHGESHEQASQRIQRVLDQTPPDAATILLTHRTRMIDESVTAGIDLMLSGHTHGGQIWPFSYLVRMANPLLAGRYELDGMTAYVTRGAGTWGPRMRLWSRGEIVRILLRSGH